MDNPEWKFPTCEKCNHPIYAGQPVLSQTGIGPHALCSDPDLDGHEKLIRPYPNDPAQIQLGYIDDNGKEVWL